MTVYVIRRARVDQYHPDKPPDEYTITDIGRVQTRLLSVHLLRNEQQPDGIYTGSSQRHKETAELLARTIEMVRGDAVSVRELTNLSDAAWTTEALQICYDERLRQEEWSKQMARGELPFDETATQVRERVLKAKRRITDETDADETIVIITSAIPVQLLALDVLNATLAETTLPVNNTGLFEFRWHSPEDSIEQLNATSHLPGSLSTRDYFVDS